MSQRLTINLTVNGRARELEVAVHHTLLEVLRDDVALTGTKECCVVGECGACTVLIDGRSVNSCLMLAVEADGTEVTTVEGLAARRRAEPAAGGLPRQQRGAVRVLHPRAADVGTGPARRRSTTPATSRSRKRSRATSAAAPGYEQIFTAVRQAARSGTA